MFSQVFLRFVDKLVIKQQQIRDFIMSPTLMLFIVNMCSAQISVMESNKNVTTCVQHYVYETEKMAPKMFDKSIELTESHYNKALNHVIRIYPFKWSFWKLLKTFFINNLSLLRGLFMKKKIAFAMFAPFFAIVGIWLASVSLVCLSFQKIISK